MPATMTHQLFAQTIINLHPRFNNLSKEMFNIMMLATQGPDPFFFYGMHPLIKREDKKRVQNIGNRLHHEDPAKNLKALLDHAFNESSKNKEIKVHYALGALMHYVLDRHVHAYVFSISGFDQDGQLSHPYNVFHSYSETLIDVAILKHKNEKVFKFHPKKNIQLPHHVLEVIQELYQHTYPDLVMKEDFIKAARDMVSIYRTVYDRYGIKHALLKLFLGKNAQAFAASHPRKLSKKEHFIDVLNLNKKGWVHPEHNTEEKTTVIEMFEAATKDMLALLEQIDKNILDLEGYAKNKSYDGMTIGKKMRYQSLRFPL
ncbi:MAG: hypothetical protein O2987_04010 [Firmicutes bacterium]|nr:hypothetical protein [Bacillota bacterium]